MLQDLTALAVGIVIGLVSATPVALFIFFSRQARQQRNDLPQWMNRNQTPGKFPSLMQNVSSLSQEQFCHFMANSVALDDFDRQCELEKKRSQPRPQWTVVEGRRLTGK